MNRFLTCTAVGLFLGLAPALAEPQLPADDAQTPPAVNQPSQIPEVMPDSAQPSEPAAPIPGDSSQVTPSPMQPGDSAAPPAQSSEAPLSIEPAAPKAADASGSGQFLSKQASDDVLATNLIGQSVYNAQDENIGDINDLVSDRGGKIVAVLIGSGGFLGLGEKDVAVRFEDLKLARDESDNVKIIADLNKETLAAAPDYETLYEQKVTVGSTKGDREDVPVERTN
ncbi:MAG: PRC-barrel domain-containing protein [Methyloceanibacter sp.]